MCLNCYCLQLKEQIESSCAEKDGNGLLNDNENIVCVWRNVNAVLDWGIGGENTDRGKRIFQNNPVLVSNYPTEFPHSIAWDRSPISMMRDLRITAETWRGLHVFGVGCGR